MFLSAIGLALIVVVMLDLFWTTLTTRGSGFCTKWISQGVRWILMSFRQMLGTRAPLAVAGPAILVLLGLFWIAALWFAWFLVFSGLTVPVVDADSKQTADALQVAYYVSFTLSTLGIGDYRPEGALARFLTGAAAFNGLVLVTLFITYIIPVVSAAIARRQMAYAIALLGDTPVDILRQTWSSSGFRNLESTLERLENPLIHCTEQRLAYPVVDYFFSRTSAFSLSLQLVKLDEALTLASTGLDDSCQPNPFVKKRIRGIITHYLESSTANTASTSTSQPELPFASLDEWSSRAQPLISRRDPKTEIQRLEQLSDHRKALLQLVQSSGWHWNDVHDTH